MKKRNKTLDMQKQFRTEIAKKLTLKLEKFVDLDIEIKKVKVKNLCSTIENLLSYIETTKLNLLNAKDHYEGIALELEIFKFLDILFVYCYLLNMYRNYVEIDLNETRNLTAKSCGYFHEYQYFVYENTFRPIQDIHERPMPE